MLSRCLSRKKLAKPMETKGIQNGIQRSGGSKSEENNNVKGRRKLSSKRSKKKSMSSARREIDTFRNDRTEAVNMDKNTNTTKEFIPNPNSNTDGELFDSVLVKLSDQTDDKFIIDHQNRTRREKIEDLKNMAMGNPGDLENDLFSNMLQSYEAVLGFDIYENYKESLDVITGEYNIRSMRRRTLSDYEKESFMRRDLVLTELSDSEKNYLDSLEFIVNRYIPLMKPENITEELSHDCSSIYMNIADIYKFHLNDFHEKIEHCFENPDLLDDTFLTYEDQLTSLYTLYCTNKPSADEYLKSHEAELDELCKKNFPDIKLRIKDYLIKPVQRLMKYQLMLSSIKKYGIKAGKENTYLDTAIEVMERVPKEANDAMHVGLISGYDESGCSVKHLMLHGELKVAVGKTKPRPLHVFLFQTVVLFTEKASKLVPEYKCIDFQDTATLGYTDDKNLKFVMWFRKHNRTDIYKCQLEAMAEKETWIQNIKEAMGLKDILKRNTSCRRQLTIEINPPCLQTASPLEKVQTLMIEEAIIKAMEGHPRLGIMTERLKSNIENYIAIEFIIPAMELNKSKPISPVVISRAKTLDKHRVTISDALLKLETLPRCFSNRNYSGKCTGYEIKRNIDPTTRRKESIKEIPKTM